MADLLDQVYQGLSANEKVELPSRIGPYVNALVQRALESLETHGDLIKDTVARCYIESPRGERFILDPIRSNDIIEAALFLDSDGELISLINPRIERDQSHDGALRFKERGSYRVLTGPQTGKLLSWGPGTLWAPDKASVTAASASARRSEVGVLASDGSIQTVDNAKQIVEGVHVDSVQVSEVAQWQLPERYDVFISHASEDKDSVARPLYEALTARGVSVWFDEAELTLGDSLRRKIDEGLARCRFGLVILSPNFLRKEWPARELDGLVARETVTGQKAILPIWHELEAVDLARQAPTLADRLAVRTSNGFERIVEQVLGALDKR